MKQLTKLKVTLTIIVSFLLLPTFAQQVLFQQYAITQNYPVNAQHYEFVLQEHDIEAADDFEVPTGKTWTITQITVLGKNVSSVNPIPLTQYVNVRFYNNYDAGSFMEPDDPPFAEFIYIPTADDGAGDLTVNLPTTVVLTPGTYWVSVQAFKDSQPNGDGWFWYRALNTFGTHFNFKWPNLVAFPAYQDWNDADQWFQGPGNNFPPDSYLGLAFTLTGIEAPSVPISNWSIFLTIGLIIIFTIGLRKWSFK